MPLKRSTVHGGSPKRTTRYLATAREALRRTGVGRFDRHVMMSTAPGIFTAATILLKKTPVTPDEAARFVEQHEAIEGSAVWLAGGVAPTVENNYPLNRVVGLSEERLADWFRKTPYRVDPVTDDSPFFWHFVRFRDAIANPWARGGSVHWDPEEATGERTLLALLGVATLFAAVFLVLPMVSVRDKWREIPHKRHALVYFAALGLGFMFFEVVLIQKLTLFLGFPTYSLTVTLFSLLVFSGIGSLASARYRDHRNRALLTLGAALVVLTLFYQFGLGPVIGALVGMPLAARVLVSVLAVAPLGLCLGAFLPIGLTTLESLTVHRREYIAWGWAVNGFFSVVSSVLATILAMAFGFKLVLLLAMLAYSAGIAAFLRVPEPGRRAAGSA